MGIWRSLHFWELRVIIPVSGGTNFSPRADYRIPWQSSFTGIPQQCLDNVQSYLDCFIVYSRPYWKPKHRKSKFYGSNAMLKPSLKASNLVTYRASHIKMLAPAKLEPSTPTDTHEPTTFMQQGSFLFCSFCTSELNMPF